MTVEEFSKVFLNGPLDRPVIDKTDRGEIRFPSGVYGGPATPRLLPGDATSFGDASGPSIFTAVQEQLGLKLEPAKGLGESLAIDSVERLEEN